MRILFKITCICFTGTLILILAWYCRHKPPFRHTYIHPVETIKQGFGEYGRLKAQAITLRKYNTAHYYNTDIVFLVDMKIASGRNRFFVYDLQRDSILVSALVAHGSCDNGFQLHPDFSNKVNSGCSSLGRFRVGNSYNGRFGIAFKLYGLDSSNSNAYNRAIVLHSYECIPDQEIFPLPVCNSRGCPMVSVAILQKLKGYLENADKPVVLDVYY